VCVCVNKRHGELNRLEGNNVVETHETLLPFVTKKENWLANWKGSCFWT